MVNLILLYFNLYSNFVYLIPLMLLIPLILRPFQGSTLHHILQETSSSFLTSITELELGNELTLLTPHSSLLTLSVSTKCLAFPRRRLLGSLHRSDRQCAMPILVGRGVFAGRS
jgi:hypothetical protein